MGNLRQVFVSFGILLAASAQGADIPVAATRLTVVHGYNGFFSRQSVTYSAKDVAITKGAGIDPEQVSVSFRILYGKWYAKGEWPVPAGTANGWLVNDAKRARYVNREAPSGPSDVKKVTIVPGKVLKLVAKGLGPTHFDVDPNLVGDPYGPVYTATCVSNGAEENCHCSEFAACAWTEISDGLGAKLICKGGTGDPSCRASCSDLVDQGATALDGCSSLEWEKKDTAPGSGIDASNLHDVDNPYLWAGRCSLDTGVLCQPNATAAAACTAQTGGALGCGECGPAQGTCTVGGAITTVWDWLSQLNAANFAGHADWRLPTGAFGFGLGSPTGPAEELASLADHRCNVDSWCTGAALGPAASSYYWTSLTAPDAETHALGHQFFQIFGEASAPPANIAAMHKDDEAFGTKVRAVRDAP